jgi:membrane associated rhomboid family serine protease
MDIPKLYHSILSDAEETKGPLPIGSLVLGIAIIVTSIVLFEYPVLKYLFAKKHKYPLLFAGLNNITSAFVHGSTTHLYSNMFFYFLTAPLIERKIGTINFLTLFFLGCIAAGFFSYVKLGSSNGLSIGASAGISSMLLYFALISFSKRIRIFNLFNIPGYLFVAPVILFVIGDYVSAKRAISRVNHWAHIGGYFSAALFYAQYMFPKKNIVNTNYLKNNFKSFLLMAFFPPLWMLLKKEYVYTGVTTFVMFKSINMAYFLGIIIFIAMTNVDQSKQYAEARKD